MSRSRRYIECRHRRHGRSSRAAQFNDELQRDELTRAASNTGTADSDDLEGSGQRARPTRRSNSRTSAKRPPTRRTRSPPPSEAAEEQTAEYQQAAPRPKPSSANSSSRRKSAAPGVVGADAGRGGGCAGPRRRAGGSSRPGTTAGVHRRTHQRRHQPVERWRWWQHLVLRWRRRQHRQWRWWGGNSIGGGGGNAPAAPAPAPIPAGVVARRHGGERRRSQLGVPYVYAAAKPGVSFDCSGLTMYAWGIAGVGLPHQSAQQYASVPHVPSSAAQPGDLSSSTARSAMSASTSAAGR